MVDVEAASSSLLSSARKINGEPSSSASNWASLTIDGKSINGGGDEVRQEKEMMRMKAGGARANGTVVVKSLGEDISFVRSLSFEAL